MDRPKPDPVEPGQESVWDYPRPPRVEPSTRRVRVEFNGETIADSKEALRVLETSSPPTIYIPRADVRMEFLQRAEGTTFCEWKGRANYFDLRVRDRVSWEAAWSYANPSAGYDELKDHVAFYAGRVDAAFLDEELAIPQPGVFYGGWVTANIVGPFKGIPGSHGW